VTPLSLASFGAAPDSLRRIVCQCRCPCLRLHLCVVWLRPRAAASVHWPLGLDFVQTLVLCPLCLRTTVEGTLLPCGDLSLSPARTATTIMLRVLRRCPGGVPAPLGILPTATRHLRPRPRRGLRAGPLSSRAGPASGRRCLTATSCRRARPSPGGASGAACPGRVRLLGALARVFLMPTSVGSTPPASPSHVSFLRVGYAGKDKPHEVGAWRGLRHGGMSGLRPT